MNAKSRAKARQQLNKNRFNNKWLLMNDLELRVSLLFEMAKITTDVIANVIASTRGSNVFVWIASTRLITIVAPSFIYMPLVPRRTLIILRVTNCYRVIARLSGYYYIIDLRAEHFETLRKIIDISINCNNINSIIYCCVTIV